MSSSFSSANNSKKVKLQKYLIHHQLAQSNKHVKKLIADGLVFVNGVQARSVSIMVAFDNNDNGQGCCSVIVVKNKQLSEQESTSSSRTAKDASSTLTTNLQQPLVEKIQEDVGNNPCILFYKPCGMICTMTTSTSNTELLFDNTTTLVDISPPLPPGFHPVGRLDQHSHGLLLCSCDGRLTSALLSPKSQISRIYTVIVQGNVGIIGDQIYKNIIENVKNGVPTEYGTFQGCILDMKRNVDRDYVHSHCDPNRGCRKDKHDHDTKTWPGDRDCNNKKKQDMQILSSITIQVKEGKKRMIRRLFAALNLHVLDLRRDKYGDMELNDHHLQPGQWRYANAHEVSWCRNLMQIWSNNDGGKGWDI